MAQQFDYPKTETQLREIQDALYQHSKEVYEAGGRPAFKGLLEIMSAESTIITAIHNIKGNHGSETPGVDSKTMRKDYLQKPFPWVVADIQRAFKYFEPQQIRRVYIDKPGKSEKRPLGIPAIRDRIVQECMRIVLEPILEAQFFAHSYGFRPMRDAAMALERVDIIMHNTGNYWIVEGDISKCFDRIDHSILIKRLYHMGIKDRRVLQIIKAMLKAGVMEERAVNEEGTPQGGLISPLLANVYLDIMDEWVSKQWENKRTRHQYVQDQSRYAVMRKKTTLVPGYLVRYADDFIIATDTRAHAEDWKARLQSFLQEKMKLTLSQEKTLITDIRKKYIKFLGYEFKMVRGKSRRGYIPRTIPDRERLKRRADKIAEDIKKIPGNYSREQMVGAINRINSQIRGIIQYYQCCTWVNIAMQKHSRKLQLAARRRLKQYNGKWIPANQTRNLPRVHQQYKQKIPSIKYRDIYVGFTALTFCRWERTPPKNQAETPYTDTGRQLYFERTKKKKMQARLDEMYSDRSARAISYGKWGKFNNFEFIMNRAYALNRDKLRCRVCGGWLIATVHDVTLEYPGQIIKLSAYDKPASLGVAITKRGNAQVMAGQSMRYDLTVANTSNVPLESFFWHDKIPYDVARPTTLTTGTYSARLNYRILYKTNYNVSYQVLASNLLTSNNYSLSLNAIPIQAGEVVTDIYFDFGKVPVGFQSIVNPTLSVMVNGNAVNGYQMVNRADVGGKYQGTWQTATASWVTIIRRLWNTPTLPKTGY